ncbi:MAG: nitrite reductase small subunit NirD [Pseudomonadota bacterium]
MSNQWKVICRVTDIPILGARVLQRRAGEGLPARPDVAIFRNGEDRVFALLDRCPHKNGPLSQGIVFGDRVACPLHGWHIELGSGCAVAPDEGCVQRFSLKIENGDVFLDADELAQQPAETVAHNPCLHE